MNTAKKQTQNFDNTSPLEIIKDVGSGVADIAKIAAEQVGLTPRKPQQNTEIVMGQSSQVIELAKRADAAEKKVDQLKAGFFRKANQETQVLYDRQSEIEKQKIEQVVLALKMEAESIKNQAALLTGETKNITVSSNKFESNKYNLNFFAWVLDMLREAKKDILKSRTWLAAFNTKKNKKGYWSMFKKHGTSFAMSDERSLATAAG